MLFQGTLIKERGKEGHNGGQSQYRSTPHSWDADPNSSRSALNLLWHL